MGSSGIWECLSNGDAPQLEGIEYGIWNDITPLRLPALDDNLTDDGTSGEVLLVVEGRHVATLKISSGRKEIRSLILFLKIIKAALLSHSPSLFRQSEFN